MRSKKTTLVQIALFLIPRERTNTVIAVSCKLYLQDHTSSFTSSFKRRWTRERASSQLPQATHQREYSSQSDPGGASYHHVVCLIPCDERLSPNTKARYKTVRRRWKNMGLSAAGATDQKLPQHTKENLVLDQMEKDPSRISGPRVVKEEIARNTGVHLKRYVQSNRQSRNGSWSAI